MFNDTTWEYPWVFYNPRNSKDLIQSLLENYLIKIE